MVSFGQLVDLALLFLNYLQQQVHFDLLQFRQLLDVVDGVCDVQHLVFDDSVLIQNHGVFFIVVFEQDAVVLLELVQGLDHMLVPLVHIFYQFCFLVCALALRLLALCIFATHLSLQEGEKILVGVLGPGLFVFCYL